MEVEAGAKEGGADAVAVARAGGGGEESGDLAHHRLMFKGKGLRVLVWYNAAMMTFHAVLGAVTLGLGNLGLTVPVYELAYRLEVFPTTTTNATATAGESPGRGWKLVPSGGRVVMQLHFTWMTAMFFFISAAFHCGNAFLWRKWYLDGIRNCMCPSRWIEYTFSASLMALLIAYGAGSNVLQLLICIFFLSATTMFFGHITELLARPAQDHQTWTRHWLYRLQAHFMGYVPQIAAWVVIMISFHTIAETASATVVTEGGEVEEVRMPRFVFAIVWAELALFWGFGLTQLAVTLAPPRYYAYGELCYQIMSLVSKGLLGIILIANVLMLSEF